MNNEVLKHIFQSSFDYKRYCIEILNKVFGCTDISTSPEHLDTTTDGDECYYIGRMADADGRELGFFYTRMANGSDVRRKRVGLRKLIAPYLKYDVDAAIAVFADNRHWRFSYICDLKEGSTAAKRFSYILGDEKGQYKTPLERLSRISSASTFRLSDLREAFSVDALSKEFFDEYHSHYDNIVDELKRQGLEGAAIHDYVKKMMGRIVFLHFLQKKGWLNNNPAFLRDLFFFSPHQSDFLEQVLEPLFFGIFNTESNLRETLFAREHWDIDLLKQWEKLPYLNGGLFERDAIDDLNITLPASLFEALFNFMASYNFTVDENDPDDAEVGVDPEMLGKIFESLLEDNKAKGAFYTPKEIVRYMCKESLIAYLGTQASRLHADETSALHAIRTFVETHEMQPELEPYRETLDKALRDVKICDPAIGSGAFPMGLLNELWRCREAVEGTLSRVELKKEIIENNIYGVDIEKGAIDIARLRFWLSIVVDAETPEPLPNFDYKFMQGNSLIESFDGFDLSGIAGRPAGRPSASAQLTIGLDSKSNQRNLHRLIKDYFAVTDHRKKADLRQAINDEVKSLITNSIGTSPSTQQHLSALDVSANQDFFLWHTWFKDIFDKGGFDIVIGNPPYGANIDKLVNVYSELYPSTSRGFKDIYKYFFDFSLKICCIKGIVSFVTPNTYLIQPRYKDLRTLFLKTKLLQILNLGENVFENAVVPVAITILYNSTNSDSAIVDFIDMTKILTTDNVRTLLSDIGFKRIKQSDWNKTPNNIFIETILEHSVKTVMLDEILKFKDAGINYQRVNVGLSQKGKSDLSKRLLYEGVKDCSDDFEYWKGSDINQYYIAPQTRRFCRTNIVLSSNERVILNKDYFDIHPKLLWRQTAPYPICTVDYKGIWFGRSIQAGLIIPKYQKKISYEYLCGLLNSKYLRYLYEQNVKEGGRVFPQVKLEHLKPLPIVVDNKEIQQQIEVLVKRILDIKKSSFVADTNAIENEINTYVYQLYDLTREEIAIIEQ